LSENLYDFKTHFDERLFLSKIIGLINDPKPKIKVKVIATIRNIISKRTKNDIFDIMSNLVNQETLDWIKLKVD